MEKGETDVKRKQQRKKRMNIGGVYSFLAKGKEEEIDATMRYSLGQLRLQL